MLADSITLITAGLTVAIIALWLLGWLLDDGEPVDEVREERSRRAN